MSAYANECKNRNKIQLELLAENHQHINDSRISFDEAKHNYFIDGKKVKFSVTEIIDKFFAEFDSDYWAKRKAIEKLNQDMFSI